MYKQYIENIRQANPLIHHITNYVTVNDCANVTLAIGGSPIMSANVDEMRQILSMSSALVVNIGTMDKVNCYNTAPKIANELKVPIILDPVGVGASSIRKKLVHNILNSSKIAVIKGNISEIVAIYNMGVFSEEFDENSDDFNVSEENPDISANKPHFSIVHNEFSEKEDVFAQDHSNHISITSNEKPSIFNTADYFTAEDLSYNEIILEHKTPNSSDMFISQGVDVSKNHKDMSEEEIIEIALTVSQRYDTVVAVTGKTDIIAHDTNVYTIENGVEYLSKITGTGCMTASLIATFVGANKINPLMSTVYAVTTMGIAGEIGYEKTKDKGTGSFKVALIDEISMMNEEKFDTYLKISKIR